MICKILYSHGSRDVLHVSMEMITVWKKLKSQDSLSFYQYVFSGWCQFIENHSVDKS